MDSLRHLTAARRWLMLAVLALILAARVAVPGGWMPVAAGDGGLVLVPCSGMGAMEMSPTMSDHAMPGMADHLDKQAPDHPQPGDHPCVGAGVSLALETHDVAPPIVAIRHYQPLVARVATVSVGRGLAAPPPPATGPPARV